MSLRFSFLALLFAAATLLQASEKPVVTVSIIPLKSFVEKIAGDAVDINVMVLPGNSPATYEPKPSQMRALAHSDLYFAIGVPFETVWLPRFEDQNRKMAIIRTQDGIDLLEMAAHHHEGEADHDDHDADHAEHDGEEDRHTGKDPHVWLAPSCVKTVSKNILDALIKLIPGDQARFTANYLRFTKEIDALDAQLKTLLAPIKGEAFMVFHPSWGYFAREYGLKQLPIEMEGKEPKPAQLGEFITDAKQHRVKAIFVQPEFSQKAAKLIAAEVGVNVVSVSSLAPDWSENLIRFAKTFRTEAP